MEFRIARPENDEGSEWKKEKEEERFLCARKGDMLSAPFQCDFCWFVNLQQREANLASPADKLLMAYIRRVNLDIMWSREESTVASTLGQFCKGRDLSLELGLKPVEVPLGPWPVEDTQGFQIAIELLRASQRRGRNDRAYVQFDSIRKLRSAYANVFQSSPQVVHRNLLLKGPKGNSFALTNAPTDSLVFRMFMMGCEKRMGRLVIQELGFTVEMVKAMLDLWDQELESESVNAKRKRDLVVVGSSLVVLAGGALRGGEVLLLEASELIKHRLDGRNHLEHPHVVIPLMGRFKNETGERNMMLALASKTSSGIEIRKWVERLIILLMREGKGSTVGPALCEKDGTVMARWKINGIIREALLRIQNETNLIPDDVDVVNKFSIHRSARRGMYTRAREAKVPEFIILANMRWSKVQRKSGSMPNLPMTELYLEISQTLATKVAFSFAL